MTRYRNNQTWSSMNMDATLSSARESNQAYRETAPFHPDRLPMGGWTLIPLRLIVGYGFLAHGLAKLSRGPDAFAGILHTIGVPLPHFMAWATVLTEVFGGIAIILGAFVTVASIPLAAILFVAIFTVHLPYGFSSIKLIAVTPSGAQFGPPGYECDLLYLACLAALVMGGSGPLAIDALIKKRRKVAIHGPALNIAN